MKMSIPIGIVLFLAFVLTMSVAQAQQPGQGSCLVDFSGMFCPPPRGGIARDGLGQVLCGPGECVRDGLGQVFCSSQPNGYAARIGWERLDALVAAYGGHNLIVKGCDSGLRFAP